MALALVALALVATLTLMGTVIVPITPLLHGRWRGNCNCRSSLGHRRSDHFAFHHDDGLRGFFTFHSICRAIRSHGDYRDGLSLRHRSGEGAGRERPLVLLPRRPRVIEHRLVADELVAVLLQDGAGEGFAANHKHCLVVLLQFVHQRNEVAVATDDRERIDVIVRKRHFQRIERQIDVRAILITTGRRIALDHLDCILRELTRGILQPPPVGVGDLGDDLAPLFHGFQNN